MRLMFLLAALLLFAPPSMAQQTKNEIRDAVSGRATILLGHRDYKGLNALADEYRASGEKTPEGTSKLSQFYAGVAALPMTPNPTDEEWQAIFMFAEEWIQKYPSPAAYIARAEVNLRYAWQKRGADGTTSPEREKAFRDHIRAAHQQLEDCKTIAGSDPEWAAAMARVARAEALPALASAPTVGSAPLVIPQVTYSQTDEINIRAGIKVRARILFEQGKFGELNALAKQFYDGERTPAGIPKLQFFYEGLVEYAHYQTPSLAAVPNEKGWQRMFDRVQAWIAQSPSPAAYIALANFHHAFAWEWRGGGFARAVSHSAWTPYREQLKIERGVLEAHKSEAAVDPEWYFTMENLALEQNWPQSESQRLYAEALSKNRFYDRVYYAIATRLEPQWGGSWEAVEQMANASARSTRDKMGDIFYTRIYQWAIDCGCQMFRKSRVDWPRMKAGFQEMLRRFPDPWNANQFANFACEAEDRATAKALLANLPLVITPAWDGGENVYQACKAWAQAG